MGPNFVLDKGFATAAAIPKYSCVKLTSATAVATTSSLGELAIGVCQEEISAADGVLGRIADIRILGISRVIAGANNLAIGARVRASASGQVVALAATTLAQNQVGVLLAASTAVGDHLDCLLTIGAQAGT